MKKLIAMLLSLVLCASLLAGCANETTTTQEEETTTTDTTQQETADPAPETEEPAPAPVEEEETPAAPKYVFLFIGDGMSYPQIQSTNYYLSALENGTSMGGDGAILEHEDALSFIDFPVAGSAQTYDSTSFCPTPLPPPPPFRPATRPTAARSTWTRPAPSRMRPLRKS